MAGYISLLNKTLTSFVLNKIDPHYDKINFHSQHIPFLYDTIA